jgi:anti-sigma regulatory factor (Ser/Thr protein kinase)
VTSVDRLSLEPASASPSAARRWLADQLAGYPESMVADAALLVSEVVTNAVLHAGTTIEVAIHAREGVRVEVADGSTVLPNAKGYIADAATGRGLMLLEAMAAAWGVEVRPSGKVVWFDVAAPAGAGTAESAVADLADLDAWPDLDDWPELDAPSEADAAVAGGVDLVDIRVIAFPLGLLKTTSQQYDALFRELRLILEHAEGDAHAIPRRLMALSDELAGQYSSFTVSADAALAEAQARGDPTIDLDYHVPPDIGRASAHYDELLDEADRWCRAGRELLTLAPKPEAVALRKWLLGEFVRQSAGEPPCPWPDSPWAVGIS